MSLQNPYILNGMSLIVNPANVNPNRDLLEIEKRLVNQGVIKATELSDPSDILSRDLYQMSNKLGISCDPPRKKKLEDSPREPSSNADDHKANSSRLSSTGIFNSAEDPIVSPPTFETPSKQYVIPMENAKSPTDDDEEPVSLWPTKSSTTFSPSSELGWKTKEQEKQHQIDRIMGADEGGFNFDSEREEDERSTIIAEIDELLTLLSNETNLSSIPTITDETPIEQLRRILRILKRKNDTVRFCSFAEEFAMFAACSLEDLFNGERTWFGKYKPNLTGWHTHVEVKLKRMRYDTRQIVSQFMQGLGVSSLFRVALELIPNMILYSKMNSKKTITDGSFDVDLAKSADQLNNL